MLGGILESCSLVFPLPLDALSSRNLQLAAAPCDLGRDLWSCRAPQLYNGSVAEVATLVDAFQLLGPTFGLAIASLNVCAVVYLMLQQPTAKISKLFTRQCCLNLLAAAGFLHLLSIVIAAARRSRMWMKVAGKDNNPSSSSCSSSNEDMGRETVITAARRRSELWVSGREHHGVQHLAVIMDGNRRYGKQQHSRGDKISGAGCDASPADLIKTTPLSGHHAGGEKLMEFIQWCIELKVYMLTVYAFSTENWSRPQQEIDVLMHLFEHFFGKIRMMAHKHGIFIRFISTDPQLLPERIRALMIAVEEETRSLHVARKIVVNVCVSYGGRSEIVNACSALLLKSISSSRREVDDVREMDQRCGASAASAITCSADCNTALKIGKRSRKSHKLSPSPSTIDMKTNGSQLEQIPALSRSRSSTSSSCSSRSHGIELQEADVGRHMLRSITQALHEQEDVDVLDHSGADPQALLRTSGEQRISNFLLWQCAYAELFFVKKTWPEITRDDVAVLLAEFEERQRRFGK